MPEPSVTTMPDPMAKWTPVPDWSAVSILRDGWFAKPVIGLSLTLVAGNMATASATLAPDLPKVGLWQMAGAPDHIIRIARDKALIVTALPMTFETGWNPAGFSATDASSGYGVIEIAGPALPDIIAEATAAELNAGSRSAAVLFAGIPCLVTRTSPDTSRVYAEAGYMMYLWRWLETR